PPRLTANFHTVFNVVLALPFLLLVPVTARILERYVRAGGPMTDQDLPGTPLYLDDAVLSVPGLALSNTARETMRMADIVERMLIRVTDAFSSSNEQSVTEIGVLDDNVDSLYHAIKLYLTRIEFVVDDEAARAQYTEVLTFATNLEHIGDIIDKNLKELAAK